MKTCSTCNEIKEIAEFPKGINQCKACRKQYRKQYQQNNKEEIKQRKKQYYQDNKEDIEEYRKQYQQDNKEEIKQQRKQYYQDNKEEIRKYQQDNKEDIKEYQKQYKQNNKEEIKQHKKQYQQDNKEEIKEYRKQYVNNKLKTDINFKLACSLRARLCNMIRRGQKAGSAVKDLGCSVEFLKTYLESKFKPGMTWENWSQIGWHIDHITPLSSFDLTDREQFLKACHYSNLQPLWAEENLSKSDNI